MIYEFLTLIVVLLIVYHISWSNTSFVKKINIIPGPKSYPIFGNAIHLLLLSPKGIHKWIINELAPIGPIIRIWYLCKVIIGIRGADEVETILKGTKHITKSDTYNYMKEWLGQGIIPTTGQRWKLYRKALTPAFHFNILQTFLPIFNRNASIFSECIEKDKDKFNNGIDIIPYSARCSFDIICESSMGTTVNAQLKMDSPYVNSTMRIVELVTERYFTPLLRNDFIWKLSPQKRAMEKHCKFIYDYSVEVLRQRREYLKTINENNLEDDENVYTRKHNMVFLDLLLAEEGKHDEYFNEEDLIYNINTFMFAGFDTIATTISFVLFLLGNHPDIQEKVVEELVEVFGKSGREPDVNDLSNLKLLERCMKESLRVYPTIPFIERALLEDETIGGYEIPAGCTLTFNLHTLHKDPKYFNNPEIFDPDRFLPENNIGRHPYTFVPFSAGPRNCIGQKYAMLEGKAILSTLLRKYKFESVLSMEQLNKNLKVGMVLRPEGGIPMKIFERISHPDLKMIFP